MGLRTSDCAVQKKKHSGYCTTGCTGHSLEIIRREKCMPHEGTPLFALEVAIARSNCCMLLMPKILGANPQGGMDTWMDKWVDR